MSANRGVGGLLFICYVLLMDYVFKVIMSILTCLLTGGLGPGGVLFIFYMFLMGCVFKVIMTIFTCLLTGGLGLCF